MKNFLPALAAVAVIFLGGCAVAPAHQALSGKALPELIPIRDLVADTKTTGGYQVSPDGKKLAWLGVHYIWPAVMVKTLGQDDVKAFSISPRQFRWTADSKRLLFVADKGCDEDSHIYSGMVDGPDSDLIDLTPFQQTAAHIVRVVDGGSDIIVTENRRDKKVFDLYRVDTATGNHTLLATNPGNVPTWGVDRRGNLRARVILNGERSTLEVRQADARARIPSGSEQSWKPTAEWTIFDLMYFIEFSDDGAHAWILSNRNRDKVALVKLELANGNEEVVYSAGDVDVDFAVFSRKTARPLIAYSHPDYPKYEIFDSSVREKITRFINGTHGEKSSDKRAGVFIHSVDDEERVLSLALVTDRGTRNYLYENDTDRATLLGEDSLMRLEEKLSSIKPVSFASRDGLALHGYLTLPQVDQQKNLPMVLLVHGGPWGRDRWTGGALMPQFLANRGYAVLQINYRGSSGYGRAFMEKAVGEFAGKMHDDLIDGVNWAVANGIADPARVAIFGGSYGGYAAMVGLTFTPEVFACGIDFVGPTDLARLLETTPPYWELGKPWWTRYVGDPAKPDDRKKMDAKSPLFKADQVVRPVLILHGVNDPRVKLEQSEMMVAALRKAGKQVEYVTFQGDGHGNHKWSNRLTQFRKTEDFLAACLGGRSGGFDFYQLGSWAF
ncbi:S9 family peptidase [soil metagenome]